MLARLLFFCGLFMASLSAMAMTIYKSTDANGVVSYSAVSYTHLTLPTTPYV